MERPKWPRILMLVASGFGLFVTLYVLSMGGATARTAVLTVFVFQALAASIAATGLLLGTWVERLVDRRSRRALAIATDRAIYLVPIVGGIGLAVGAIVVLTIAVDADTLGLLIVGVAVAVGGLWASRVRETRMAIMVLAATILAVEVPRELGWFNVNFGRSSFSSSSSSSHNGTCSTHASIELRSHLTGNVGSLIESDAPDGQPSTADVVGNADAGWLTCMFPLAKPMSYSTTIHWTVSGACGGSGDLEIKESAMSWGIKSCLTARVDLAIRLRQAIGNAIHGR